MRDAGGMHSLQKQGLLISPTTFELVSRPRAKYARRGGSPKAPARLRFARQADWTKIVKSPSTLVLMPTTFSGV